VVGPANWISSWVVRAAKFFTKTLLAKKPRSRTLHIIHIIVLMMGSDDFKISHWIREHLHTSFYYFLQRLGMSPIGNTKISHSNGKTRISARRKKRPPGGGLKAQEDMDDVTAANA
jgi:hypothetical protein